MLFNKRLLRYIQMTLTMTEIERNLKLVNKKKGLLHTSRLSYSEVYLMFLLQLWFNFG